MILTKTGIETTPAQFQVAEDGLLQSLQADSVFWSGRAATSLYQAYHLAKTKRPDSSAPEIIMPAMMCTTAANTAMIAGIQPRFADVSATSGLATLETIQARYTEKTIAVVVIHLLGHLVDIDPIVQWCREKNLLLIEDPTQALGATFPDGRVAGSTGDVTIYSFNRTKIIRAGNGVLVSKTPETTEILCDLAREPLPYTLLDANQQLQLALSYRNLHHSLVGLLRINTKTVQEISSAFMMIREAYEPLYLRPVNPDVDLKSAWQNLPDVLAHRLSLANLYTKHLQGHDKWDLLTGFEQSGVCWRFSLLLDNAEQQVNFSEAVRRDGFHVSNLYWTVNQFFYPDDDCPGADYFSRRIVNLWVDETVGEDYVERCCASLLKHADALL